MGSRIPELLHAMRVVINLSGDATTWFWCTGINPGTIMWDSHSSYIVPFVLLILISRHETGWNNALKQQALRPIPGPSASNYWSAMTSVIRKQYKDIFPD